MSENLATLYRPRRFADLVGQSHVAVVLREAARRHAPPPQLLFFGGSGLGKTTVARIFAAALFCLSQMSDGDACGTCAECVDITAGRHPDLIELDAASNGGKDEIRALAERSALVPIRAKWKFYIIDECHGISAAGGQAMLRFLEDPPPHVVLAMATTNPEKLVPALKGRTLQLELLRPTDQMIANRLMIVAEQQGWPLSSELAQICVEATEPELGIRGAINTLGRLSGVLRSGLPPGPDSAAELLGVLAPSRVAALTNAIEAGDRPAAVTALEQLRERVSDTEIRSRVLRWCRAELIAACRRGGNTELQTWRYEKAAATPAGAHWTDVLVAVIAQPALDESPAAVRALLADAEATIRQLNEALTVAKSALVGQAGAVAQQVGRADQSSAGAPAHSPMPATSTRPTAPGTGPAAGPGTRSVAGAHPATAGSAPAQTSKGERNRVQDRTGTPSAADSVTPTSPTEDQLPVRRQLRRPTPDTVVPADEPTTRSGAASRRHTRATTRTSNSPAPHAATAVDTGWGEFEDGPPAVPAQPETAAGHGGPDPAEPPPAGEVPAVPAAPAVGTPVQRFLAVVRDTNPRAAQYLSRFRHIEDDGVVLFLVARNEAEEVRSSGIGAPMRHASETSGVEAKFRVA
jgi:DNA polymerase-3 subunit gamma/tau